MGATDQVNRINLIKLLGDCGAEEPAGASGTHFPCLDVIRIRPHQITEGACSTHHCEQESRNPDGQSNLDEESPERVEEFAFGRW